MSLISRWSTVANANGTLGGTPQYWPEGQAPSTVNDCARLMMATLRTQMNDASWFNWGYTVTRVSGTSFTVVTASWNTVTLPAAFEANARIKLFDTNTLYGTIQTVSVSALSTLVTFLPDTGSLTASFTSVYNSILSPTNTAIPGLNIPTNVITQTTQQIYAVDSGATNSAQITLAPVLPSYMAGQMINFKAAQTNTGSMTLQVDALGSKTIKKLGGASNLGAGDIIAGQVTTLLYDGTNWQMVSQTATGGGGSVTGAILQVVSTTKTDTFSTTSSSFTDVTGLSVSITPTSATSQIFVMFNVAGQGNSEAQCFRLVRDTTPLCIGDAAGARTSCSASVSRWFSDNYALYGTGNNYLDSPATTSTLVYKIQTVVNGGDICLVNYGNSDSANISANFRAASSITVMEVAA